MKFGVEFSACRKIEDLGNALNENIKSSVLSRAHKRVQEAGKVLNKDIESPDLLCTYL